VSNKKKGKKTRDWQELPSSSSSSLEASSDESEQDSAKEDVPRTMISRPRDANAYERTLFDGLLAVVIP
jgi:hypothetical protein